MTPRRFPPQWSVDDPISSSSGRASSSGITNGQAPAARREVSVDRLIRDLLDVIVDDKLTTAILDD